MKNTILLFVLLLAVFSCGQKEGKIRIDTSEDETLLLNFTAAKRYLLFPIEEEGEELTVRIVVDGKEERSCVVRLAKKRIDYRVPLDLSDWKGQKVQLSIPGLSDTAICVQEIEQSDVFEYDKNEKFRPGFHFTPPYGWMNDPNGMVYYKGEYHLFYQYNPYGTRWQNMTWGHAISKNLVDWEHFLVALWPDNLGCIFSGSAVVDPYNTAGFQTGGEKTLLAFYTNCCGPKGDQVQSLAYSNDKGRTWVKYSSNPVLEKESERDFRDPKVFWHEPSKKWIMILAMGQVMEIYSSSDAKTWAYESAFGEGQGVHEGVWECPDLFELPVEGNPGETRWVLICNIGAGGPSGGSASQYFVGVFDGKVFRCENRPDEIRWMDWGKDHYAAVTWSDIPENDGRHIAIAWMSNWQYANDVPALNFRGAMTVPRELKLIKKGGEYLLANYPVAELEVLRGECAVFNDIAVKDEYSIDTLLRNNNGMYELFVELECGTSETMGFQLLNSKGRFVDFSISPAAGKLYVDRRNSGITAFSDHFPAVTYAQVDEKQSYRLRILVDKASIECFEGEGEVAVTNLVFPDEPYNRIKFYARGGECRIGKLETYRLK